MPIYDPHGGLVATNLRLLVLQVSHMSCPQQKTCLEFTSLLDFYNPVLGQIQNPQSHHNHSHLIIGSGPTVEIVCNPPIDGFISKHFPFD